MNADLAKPVVLKSCFTCLESLINVTITTMDTITATYHSVDQVWTGCLEKNLLE